MAQLGSSTQSDPNAPATIGQISDLIQPFMRLVENQGKTIAAIDNRVDTIDKRQEFMDRQLRQNAVCIWNFPIKEFDLHPRTTPKFEPVCKFLENVMKIPKAETERLIFKSVNIIGYKVDSDTAMVRLDFADGDQKEMCWGYVKNIADYNKEKSIPKEKWISWSPDRTPLQREEAKKRRLNFDDQMDTNAGRAGSSRGRKRDGRR